MSTIQQIGQLQLSQRQPQSGQQTADREQDINYKKFSIDQVLYDKVQQQWYQNDIPECHQKYFHSILMKNENNLKEAQSIMNNEILSLQNNKSIVKTLYQLTVGRERCLKEICNTKFVDINEFKRQISKYTYDLRKLTLNLLEFHRKWRQRLQLQLEQDYIWLVKGHDYLLKIKDDYRTIPQQYPKMNEFFQFPKGIEEEPDIFFLSIIKQAQQENHIEYYDYLQQHKMQEKYLIKMKELQEYFYERIKGKQQIQFGLSASVSSAISPKFASNRIILPSQLPQQLPQYETKILYTQDMVQFISPTYPIQDLELILNFWYNKSSPELSQAFQYPKEHIKDLLLYNQEASLLFINNNGIMICSVDQEFNGRRWVIHLILLENIQLLGQVLDNFIIMMQKYNDPLTSLSISTSNDKIIKTQLQNLKFTQLKTTTFQKFVVTQFDRKLINLPLKKQQKYNPIQLQINRIYGEENINKLCTDEEVMIAQVCANLGKNNIVQFSQNILKISPYLNKNKIYGQEFMLHHNPKDIQIKYNIEFNTPIEQPVYFQQFNTLLNFRLFSSEINKLNQQLYFRLNAVPTIGDTEASILELSDPKTQSNRKLYLVSTIDPNIKIFIYELNQDEQDTQQIVNNAFEKFDQKIECQNALWLPQFNCKGQQIELQECTLNCYFQNNTQITISYPRIPALHTMQYTHDLEKVIQTPFLFGIVQSDIDHINKPIFSVKVNQENLLHLERNILSPRLGNVTSSLSIMALNLNSNQIEQKLNDLLKFTILEIQNSFISTHQQLMRIMYSGQEPTILEIKNAINKPIGYTVLEVDSNHIQDKRWIIVSVMTNSLEHLQNILNQTNEYIFNQDCAANEIQISQFHYHQEGELLANKIVQECIKKAGFKWRLVDADCRTQTRKTVYYLKRAQDKFPPKIMAQKCITFRSYYAFQQSNQRNKIQNCLTYINSPNEIFQIYEECFQFYLKDNELHQQQDQFIHQMLNQQQGQIEGTQFKKFNSQNEAKEEFEFKLHQNYQKINLLQTMINLKIRKHRLVKLNDQQNQYFEIPNLQQQQIYEANLFKSSNQVIFIQLQDQQYFLFVVKLQEQEKIIKSDLMTEISQAFLSKVKHQCEYLLLPSFSKIVNIGDPQNQERNQFHFEFSLNNNKILPNNIDFENTSQSKWIIKPPLIVGLLNTTIRTQFEKPLVACVIVE